MTASGRLVATIAIVLLLAVPGLSTPLAVYDDQLRHGF